MEIFNYGPLEMFRERDDKIPPKPIVFIDLDGTLIDSVRPTIEAACGRWVPPQDYDVSKWNITDQEKKRVIELFNDEEFVRNLPVIDGAPEAVRKFHKLGCRVLGLTVRPFPETTRAYCRKHFPEMEDVVFVDRNCQKKSDVVNQYDGVVAVLDDCPEYIQDIWDNTKVDTVMMICHPNHPYARKPDTMWTFALPGRVAFETSIEKIVRTLTQEEK